MGGQADPPSKRIFQEPSGSLTHVEVKVPICAPASSKTEPLENPRSPAALVTTRSGCQRKGATAGQIALAWLLHQGDDIVPIPGTKQRRHLEDNVAAVDVALSKEEMAELDAALSPENISGPRYSPERMAQVDR